MNTQLQRPGLNRTQPQAGGYHQRSMSVTHTMTENPQNMINSAINANNTTPVPSLTMSHPLLISQLHAANTVCLVEHTFATIRSARMPFTEENVRSTLQNLLQEQQKSLAAANLHIVGLNINGINEQVQQAIKGTFVRKCDQQQKKPTQIKRSSEEQEEKSEESEDETLKKSSKGKKSKKVESEDEKDVSDSDTEDKKKGKTKKTKDVSDSEEESKVDKKKSKTKSVKKQSDPEESEVEDKKKSKSKAAKSVKKAAKDESDSEDSDESEVDKKKKTAKKTTKKTTKGKKGK